MALRFGGQASEGRTLAGQAEAGSARAVRLKVTLDDYEPAMWRRLLVEDAMTLRDLHRRCRDFSVAEAEARMRRWFRPKRARTRKAPA